MRSSPRFVLMLAVVACGSKANRVCTPVPSFGAPAGECVAMAEKPKPPPPPPPKVEPKPEPEPEPEPPKPEPEPEPPPPVVVKADKIELDRTVQFESGKSKLLEDSMTLLDDVAKVLSDHSEIKLIEIQGHTDAVGSNRKNKKLSDARAKAVRVYLIGKGIDKTRMVSKGFGEDKPVADNGTEEGRFKNRRVDLKILKRDDSGGGGSDEKVEKTEQKTDDAVDDDAEKTPPKKDKKDKKGKKKKKKDKKAKVEKEE